MHIPSELEGIIATKKGNKEILMYRYEDGTWRMEVGNSCWHLPLGEVEGEFIVKGVSLVDCIHQMKHLVGVKI